MKMNFIIYALEWGASESQTIINRAIIFWLRKTGIHEQHT